jgi:hypothetical protein
LDLAARNAFRTRTAETPYGMSMAFHRFTAGMFR